MGKLRSFFNGQESSTHSFELGEDCGFNLVLTTNAGEPLDLTGATVESLWYESTTRTTSADRTIACTLPGETGAVLLSIADNESILELNATYYVWLKVTDSGVITISDRPSTIAVK